MRLQSQLSGLCGAPAARHCSTPRSPQPQYSGAFSSLRYLIYIYGIRDLISVAPSAPNSNIPSIPANGMVVTRPPLRMQ